jgi:hypothetical protein
MRATRNFLTAIAALFIGLGAFAADNSLLIQLGPDGRYRVWHSEGVTNLTEDEVLTLAAGAKPAGGDPLRVAAGTARAFQTEQGVIIEIADATTDGKLLVDRDECGAIKTWHSDGATKLTDDEVTELVISALPGGGRRVDVGGNFAKAFIAPLGYPVVIWKPVVR